MPIEAFERLFADYRDASAPAAGIGQLKTLDVDRTILTMNLFGMDLNGEAFEIARRSCWIKKAERGKKLSALGHNIVQGNSVVAESSPLE